MKIFNVNYFGVYRINKIFLPLLNDKSKIIITSSELAPLDPLPFTGLYGITKSTLEKYAYSLRMELNLLGHKVIVIRPGAVKTSLLNDSTISIDRFIDKTILYKDTSTRFKKIVDSVESKNIDPMKIAKITYKALTKKRPKFIYNINRNFLLKVLNILPDRLQVSIIGRLLK
jgi:short-subunit dehydrogenase